MRGLKINTRLKIDPSGHGDSLGFVVVSQNAPTRFEIFSLFCLHFHVSCLRITIWRNFLLLLWKMTAADATMLQCSGNPTHGFKAIFFFRRTAQKQKPALETVCKNIDLIAQKRSITKVPATTRAAEFLPITSKKRSEFFAGPKIPCWHDREKSREQSQFRRRK